MGRRAFTRVVKTVLLMASVVLALSACGGVGEGIPAGEYVTEEFEPALSFRVDDGWNAVNPETQDALVIGQKESLAIGFHNVEQVLDPRNGVQRDAAPDDIAGWLQAHPGLESEPPTRVSVGGVSGQQFDVVASDPTDVAYCSEPCVPLLVVGDGDKFWLGKSEKYRFIVLDDVEGETVTIVFGGPAVDFEEFLPKAQTVLDTVEWEGE